MLALPNTLAPQRRLPGGAFPQRTRLSRRASLPRGAAGALRRRAACATAPLAAGAPSTSAPRDAAEAKARLFNLLDGAGRGVSVSASTRVRMSEAQLALEAFGSDLDLNTLAGTWRLQYTTAADVLVLLEVERISFGFLSLGDIYQSFDAWGNIENVIKASVPLLLQPPAPLGSGASAPAGATLRVAARYAVAGSKTLRLWFDSAKLGDVNINATLETLIAPAVLPRTPPQMLLLQWLKDARLEVPLRLGLGGPDAPSDGCVTRRRASSRRLTP